MPETREKKVKNTAKLKPSVTHGAQAPHTMHTHPNDAQASSTMHKASHTVREASSVMHKHPDDAKASTRFPAKEKYTAQATDQ